MTLPHLLKEFPPVLCRLLARRNGKPVTSRQLASVSGMGRDRIDWISHQTTWDDVRVGEALRFMAACGVEVTNARRHREFMRDNNWGHLSRAKKPQYYVALLQTLIKSRQPPCE